MRENYIWSPIVPLDPREENTGRWMQWPNTKAKEQSPKDNRKSENHTSSIPGFCITIPRTRLLSPL